MLFLIDMKWHIFLFPDIKHKLSHISLQSSFYEAVRMMCGLFSNISSKELNVRPELDV